MAPHPLQPFSEAVQEASIFLWNTRSLRPYMSDTRPIIVICESRLPSAMRLVIWLCEAFRSVTCNYCSTVTYVRCELTYVEHAVTPDDNNQYVCLTVKRRNLIFSLIGVCISTSSRFDTARLSAILSETPGPWIITADQRFNADFDAPALHHALVHPVTT